MTTRHMSAIGSGLHKVVDFFRAGTSSATAWSGPGYLPLLGLLPRRLIDDEVDAIATDLMNRLQRTIDSVDIGTEIAKVTDALPSLSDIIRVERRINERRRFTAED